MQPNSPVTLTAVLALTAGAFGGCASKAGGAGPAKPARQTVKGQRDVAPTKGVICGEVLGLAYRLPGGELVTRSTSQSPAEHLAAYGRSRSGKIVHLELLRKHGGSRIECIPAEPTLKIIDPDDPGSNELRLGRGGGYYRECVRINLSPRGWASRIEPAPAGWMGVLQEVTSSSITVRGYRGHPDGGKLGFFQSWEPEWYPDVASRGTGYKPVTFRVPLSSETSFAVNRDAVYRERLSKEVGRVVEVTADCESRARYVDVYRVNDFFNQTGGNIPLITKADGSLALEERRGASGGKPERMLRVRVSPGVKIYDEDGCRIPEVSKFHGFIGAWVEPNSGLATHLFLSGDTE